MLETHITLFLTKSFVLDHLDHSMNEQVYPCLCKLRFLVLVIFMTL